MQVKLFWINGPVKDHDKTAGADPGAGSKFEGQINRWLSENPRIRINHVEQSACGGSWGSALWLISVWYSISDGMAEASA